MPKFTITFYTRVCRHPRFELRAAGITSSYNLRVCPDCGSKFPPESNIALWAPGVKVSDPQITRVV